MRAGGTVNLRVGYEDGRVYGYEQSDESLLGVHVFSVQ